MVNGKSVLALPGWLQQAIGPVSFASTLLIFLLLGSVFTTSALMSLGLGFLPVVDKGHLLLLLGFYCTTATVLFHGVRLAFSALREAVYMMHLLFLLPIAMLRHGWRPLAELGRRKGSKSHTVLRGVERLVGAKFRKLSWLHTVIALLLMLLIPAVGAFSFGARRDPSINEIDPRFFQSDQLKILLILTVLSLVAYAVSAFDRSIISFANVRKYTITTANFLAFGAALFAGPVWIEYLRFAAPKVQIFEVTAPSTFTVASIAMPATEGLLVFVQDSENARFVPWAQIARIEGALTRPMRLFSSPKIEIQGAPLRPTGPLVQLVPLLRMSAASG